LQCEEKRSKNDTENITTYGLTQTPYAYKWLGPASQQLTQQYFYIKVTTRPRFSSPLFQGRFLDLTLSWICPGFHIF